MIKLWTTSQNPATAVFWRGWDQRLIDFSLGYLFEVKMEKDTKTGTTVVTKTTGITGQVGDLAAVPQVPNVTISWDPGELAVITQAGLYVVQLKATQNARPRYMSFVAELKIPLA